MKKETIYHKRRAKPEIKDIRSDLYSAGTMNSKTMAVKIVARITDGTYFDVDSVDLYDLIIPKQKEGTLSAKPRIAEKLQAQGVPSFKITIAELLKDVKDRQGKPYVVNGKLNYDGNIFMAKDVLDAESKRYEFLHNINNFINEKFHGASNISNDGGHISFDMPNGNHIEVNSINNTVYVNPNLKAVMILIVMLERRTRMRIRRVKRYGSFYIQPQKVKMTTPNLNKVAGKKAQTVRVPKRNRIP